ncbi:hypothetical protein PN36_30080 [Candidatus Thiomargarita nelsonii]|uniref:Uncharacterized protein n=1 Tax=Candidatus Thiomargarita nelsonii TaxID=1003181 RepID=A0A0A6PDU5_9GAMM|nr:hypothetical protein PN36_30080 [Candidatus Thiomargarita nelsonii]
MSKSKSYQVELLEALRDPVEAAEYLNAALEEGDQDVFLLALKNVTEARCGIIAEKSAIKPENLSHLLSKQGHPEIRNFDALLHALGFRLAIQIADKPLMAAA